MGQANDHGALIRDAKPADDEDVADLTTKVYVGEGYSPSSAETSLRDIDRRRSLSDVIVAQSEVTGGIVGAVSVVRSGALRQVARDNEFEVRLLAVDPGARGRGIGRALLLECVRRARAAEATGVVLSTQPSMKAAQRLYESMGFRREPALDWKTSDGRPMLAHRLEIPGLSPR